MSRLTDFLRLKPSPKAPPNTKKDVKGVPLPTSRVSVPDLESGFTSLNESLIFVTPDFQYEYIDVIRKLFKVNSSVFRAATILADITNPGFTLQFDSSVKPEQRKKMIQHLDKAWRCWGLGTAGIDGIINKMILQLYIGGAISTEWVLKDDLSGVDYVAFLNPENIRTAFNSKSKRYDFYQAPDNWLSKLGGKNANYEGYIKLNPATYTYLGLFTDEESPIGTPPFLSALDDVNAQLKMLRNIGFVSDQLGLMGFLELLLEKPSQESGEADTAYRARLQSYLTNAKKAIKDGTKDGVVAGFTDEHEFKFHAPTKDTAGVADIFSINQRMVSSGLLTPGQFMGGNTSGAETMVTIVFTLMLSQLNTVQKFLSHNIEQGLWMELTLAGFKFDWLKLEFNKSTIADELKDAQAEEIKIRNSRTLYADGQIGQEQYANRHNLESPDKKEPRVAIDADKQQGEVDKKKKDQDKENDTDQKSRGKKKDQPKGKSTKQL